jgi:hypothetical protein
VSFSPLTAGTSEVNGPADRCTVTVVPLIVRPDGLVLTTRPAATVLLSTDEPFTTWKPLVLRAVVATLSESPVTFGIEAYRPEVSHQPPMPTTAITARVSATAVSRLLNSHRPRKDSRPRRYRSVSSRWTTMVCEAGCPP